VFSPEQQPHRPPEKRYRQSAGILAYRHTERGLEVLLGHPGGPFWAHKDAESWTMFKGEFDSATETPIEAARREFAEETGFDPDSLGEELLDLGVHRQSGGKLVYAFAAEADFDAAAVSSNIFDLEYPPRTGRFVTIPEIDRAAWFTLSEAADKIMKGQRPFLERLAARIGDARNNG